MPRLTRNARSRSYPDRITQPTPPASAPGPLCRVTYLRELPLARPMDAGALDLAPVRHGAACWPRRVPPRTEVYDEAEQPTLYVRRTLPGRPALSTPTAAHLMTAQVMGGSVQDPEKEARNRLIDAARCDLMSSTGPRTEVPEALDRLSQQAYGDADRLRGAAEQLRRRFDGAEAIPLLEAAARHVDAATESEPPFHERSDPAGTAPPEPDPTLTVRSLSDRGSPSPAGLAHPSGARPRDD
jgi:hypothetical protein